MATIAPNLELFKIRLNFEIIFQDHFSTQDEMWIYLLIFMLIEQCLEIWADSIDSMSQILNHSIQFKVFFHFYLSLKVKFSISLQNFSNTINFSAFYRFSFLGQKVYLKCSMDHQILNSFEFITSFFIILF